MTQIKHINTGIAELIAVKVPDDATAWKISGTNYLCSKINGKWEVEVPRLEDFVKWKILGIAHELTEEVWIKILESETEDGDAPYYEDYSNTSTGSYFNTATESGLSLLAANEVYAVNPYEKFNPVYVRYETNQEVRDLSVKQFEQAQQNTGKWVLLKKIEG